MNPEIPVTADELHAYVDGELAPDRLEAVQAWLETHPNDAARVAGWRAISAAVHARYDSIADEAVPKRLELEALARRPQRRWMIAACAAMLAFLIGGGTGWAIRNSTATLSPAATLTGDALDAHRLYSAEVRHPVEVVAAEKTHMVQWLSRRVGYPVPAPELEQSAGLKLVGGRLLPGSQAPAAFIMYEAASGERFTVYCSKSAGANTQMRFQSRDRNAAVTWSDNGMGFVVSGPNDHDRIKQVAELIYDQVEKTGAPTSAPANATKN